MLNGISLILGIIALCLAGFAFLPLFGWANWAVIPVAIVGLACGIVSTGKKLGRDLNLLVIVISFFRLMIGGGVI